MPSARLLATTNAVTFLVATNAKIDIRSLQFQELEDKVREFREPLYRARQIADWLYQKRVQSFDEMTDLPQEFRSRLAEQFDFSKSEIVRVLGSHDTTRKFLLRLNDESLIETVLIPASPALYGSRSDRRTICISTQVGCAYGCKFCASGLEGFSRNLKPDKQFLKAAEAVDAPIFQCPFITMKFINLATLALEMMFAPRGTEMGSMVDILGVGVIIRGESGIGKSECVLALIERGYSLVADDVTKVTLVDGREVVGTSAELIRVSVGHALPPTDSRQRAARVPTGRPRTSCSPTTRKKPKRNSSNWPTASSPNDFKSASSPAGAPPRTGSLRP